MARGKMVNPDLVARVKEMKRKHPTLTHDMISDLCYVSRSTVGRILGGEYDKMLEPARLPLFEGDAEDDLPADKLDEIMRNQEKIIKLLIVSNMINADIGGCDLHEIAVKAKAAYEEVRAKKASTDRHEKSE